MAGTAQYVEQRLMKRRTQEAKDMDLKRKVAEGSIFAGYAKSDARVEELRQKRLEGVERRELYTDYQFAKAEQDKARQSQIAQFEEHLADELAKRKAEQQRQDMDKMRICAASEELRSLKANLHMAQVNKDRAQQLLEQEVRKERDRLLEEKLAESMENQRLQHLELEHKLEFEKVKQRERVKMINQQQIATKEAQREEALIEHLREKAQVQEVVDKIANEDAQELAVREQKKAETKIGMQKFAIEVKERKAAAIAADREEEARIEEFARKKREFEEGELAKKEEQEREKVRILNRMLGVMEAKNKEAEELEYLRNEMYSEELEAASRRREEAQKQKIVNMRKDMHSAYVMQMEAKEAKMQREKEEEDKLRQHILDKYAEDDRIDQMNDQKRRMRVQEHKREAERLVQMKRDEFEAARRAEVEHEEKMREDEKVRQTIVEEERRRLLKEHGAQLKSFLPKGTMESATDLDD